MGGKAFERITNALINVPRMSPATYQQIAAHVKSKLETLFLQVTIPREAPAKADYGDIDFLVNGIRAPNNGSNIWTAVKALLGAEFRVDHSFAVRHPQVPGAYVQVDVELSKEGLFEWERFMKSDSDLVQIIGIIHRSLGLTCNDKGLHVRVEEVETYNKKASQIFLTNNPNEALDFYGLDKAKYAQGFTSETDLFDWITTGHFFFWKVYEDREESSNDRARLRKRPMFNRFVGEYMINSGKATVIGKVSDANALNPTKLPRPDPAAKTYFKRRCALSASRKSMTRSCSNTRRKGLKSHFGSKSPSPCRNPLEPRLQA